MSDMETETVEVEIYLTLWHHFCVVYQKRQNADFNLMMNTNL